LADNNWSVCPRCGSKKVQSVSKWLLGFVLFLSAGIFVWIPFLWLLIPIVLILSALAFLAAFFAKSMWQCQDCKHTWPKS